MILKFNSFEKGAHCTVHVFDNIESVHYKYIKSSRANLKIDVNVNTKIRRFYDLSVDGDVNSKTEKTFIRLQADLRDGGCIVFVTDVTVFACNDNGQTIERYKVSNKV